MYREDSCQFPTQSIEDAKVCDLAAALLDSVNADTRVLSMDQYLIGPFDEIHVATLIDHNNRLHGGNLVDQTNRLKAIMAIVNEDRGPGNLLDITRFVQRVGFEISFIERKKEPVEAKSWEERERDRERRRVAKERQRARARGEVESNPDNEKIIKILNDYQREKEVQSQSSPKSPITPLDSLDISVKKSRKSIVKEVLEPMEQQAIIQHLPLKTQVFPINANGSKTNPSWNRIPIVSPPKRQELLLHQNISTVHKPSTIRQPTQMVTRNMALVKATPMEPLVDNGRGRLMSTKMLPASIRDSVPKIAPNQLAATRRQMPTANPIAQPRNNGVRPMYSNSRHAIPPIRDDSLSFEAINPEKYWPVMSNREAVDMGFVGFEIDEEDTPIEEPEAVYRRRRAQAPAAPPAPKRQRK